MKYRATFYREFTADIEAPDLEAARAKARQIVAADGEGLRLASVVGSSPQLAEMAAPREPVRAPAEASNDGGKSAASSADGPKPSGRT